MCKIISCNNTLYGKSLNTQPNPKGTCSGCFLQDKDCDGSYCNNKSVILVPDTEEVHNLVSNSVSHPHYYNQHPSGVECIDIVRHYSFNVGNVIKYIWRAGLKHEFGLSDREKELQDCEKALWYITDHINTLKKELNK